ncbi:DUF1254 domain-containing protein [Neorhizobium sp. P12A]|uniref:DUF1254 domain-containing protein n=1 Tax=Neorhizobium sp. P12A TaxID=2268027 RepID=UPI0011EFBBBB|nr:DUF1254 domain-containing protein [Neorhizobium sp. P12A]KAA0699942.1 DUF1254 domain-containing protein [Neorhizobium sp. P12A]
MFRIVSAVLTGIFGAALLHLVIILSLPHFSDRDAYTRVEDEGDENHFYMLDDKDDDAGLSNGDPYIKTAVCAFDLGDQPIRLTAAGKVPFWSLSIYDRASNEVFSMSDRTSVGGLLDVLVASPIQLTTLRKALPPSLSQAILVEMPHPEGYAVLRTMAPQSSFDEAARGFLAEAGCDVFDGS